VAKTPRARRGSGGWGASGIRSGSCDDNNRRQKNRSARGYEGPANWANEIDAEDAKVRGSRVHAVSELTRHHATRSTWGSGPAGRDRGDRGARREKVFRGLFGSWGGPSHAEAGGTTGGPAGKDGRQMVARKVHLDGESHNGSSTHRKYVGRSWCPCPGEKLQKNKQPNLSAVRACGKRDT